jgi:hypothetical protein
MFLLLGDVPSRIHHAVFPDDTLIEGGMMPRARLRLTRE